MVGDNLKDVQLQQIVDKTIIYADKDGDGMVSFDEFCAVRSSQSPPSLSLSLAMSPLKCPFSSLSSRDLLMS